MEKHTSLKLTKIPRANDALDFPCWIPSHGLRPYIRCICGSMASLGDHFIGDKGNVRPLFRHRCGWEVDLILEDYDGERWHRHENLEKKLKKQFKRKYERT